MANEKNEKPAKREGNAYDKIFKENAVEIFRPLIEEQLGIKIVSFTLEETKFQKTMEREVDFLYHVVTSRKESFLLHLEFQTEDDSKMLDRIAEYHGLVYAKKKKRIEHVVIYLGSKKPRMRTKLKEEEIFYGFQLLNVHTLSPEVLLASQVPEVIMIAILCDFPKEKVEVVLRLLLMRLKAAAKNKRDLEKYLNQLIILARIRKFENQTIKTVNDMTLNIDIETSILFQQGRKKGREEARQEAREEAREEQLDNAIQNLLLYGLLSDKQISEALKVSLYRVRKVKAGLKQK